MGLFDTYHINCPHCDEDVESQKKPGCMSDYYFGKDPIEDLNFRGFYSCYNCGKNFTVEMENIPKMIVKKRK